jgi:hypothetical protein
MGLGNDYPRGKGQYKLRKGQEGPTKTEIPLDTAVSGPGQCFRHFPTRMRRHAKVILKGTPVYRRGMEGPIPIGLIVL